MGIDGGRLIKRAHSGSLNTTVENNVSTALRYFCTDARVSADTCISRAGSTMLNRGSSLRSQGPGLRGAPVDEVRSNLKRGRTAQPIIATTRGQTASGDVH